LGVAGSFAPAGLPNPAAKPLDLAIQREQNSTSQSGGHAMKDKIVLVTGSTDGIGKETAMQLAQLGATVLVHGRDAERCQTTRDEIRQATGNFNVDFFVANLSSQKQVRQLATDIQSRYDRLHVLVNNAGIIVSRRQLTEDHLEMTFAVNHLAPFLLTHLLLDLLKKSAPARIVTVSSMVHKNARIDFGNLQGERRFPPFSGMRAYMVSKLANVLFTFELAERLKDTGVTSNCLHPGTVNTKLAHAGWPAIGALSPANGARGSVYLASSPEVEKLSGKYFDGKHLAEPSSKAYDLKLRQKLWEVSAILTGIAEEIQ
jgi:NAD(P)-dependent dehydrogenase (short-subunit alcohol dehydrogenase family)